MNNEHCGESLNGILRNQPEVSVIIPVFNVEEYLHECIKSVLQQSLQDIEIICVNDGSTDNSGIILEKFAKTDKRIMIINQENKGLSAARNAGLYCAIGKYIYFLDSDDYLATDALELLSSDMDSRNLDLLLFNAKVFGENGVEEKRVQDDISYFKRTHEYPLIYKGEDLMCMLWENREYLAPVFIQMVRRDLLIKHDIQFYENIIHEDELYTFKVMLCSGRAGYLNSALYYRRVRNNSIMNMDNADRLSFSAYSLLLCAEQMTVYLENSPVRQANKKEVFKAVERMAWNCKRRYGQLPIINRQKLLKNLNFWKAYSFLVEHGYANQGDNNKNIGNVALKNLLLLLAEDKTAVERVSEVPLVSVIIPIYNTACYLPFCLNSVINQTLSDIEIICVDDASEDDSKSVLKEYAGRDSRIKTLYHDKNLGTLQARKHGVEFATGKYIMFLDGDDELIPDACETAYYAIEKSLTDVVGFGVVFLNSQGIQTPRGLFTKQVGPLKGKNLIYLWKDGEINNFWNVTNKIFNAGLCKKACKEMETGHFIMAEDVYFFFVYGYFANSYSEIEKILYKYRRGVGSYSSLKEGCDLQAFRRILLSKDTFNAIKRFIVNRPDETDYQPILMKIGRHLLQDAVTIWDNNLAEPDKGNGLNALIDTWGANEVSTVVATLLQKKNSEAGKTKVLIQNKSVSPLVSIVIPVFNSALYLPACLNSVLNQTLTAIEIICIDDASVDGSKRILEMYAYLDSRIKIKHHNYNMGTLAARKHGVEIATGKYIMFLDSDDEFFPHACETAYNAIENNKTDVVRFGVEIQNYNKNDGKRKYFLTSEISKIEGRNLLWLWNKQKIKGWEMTNRIFSSRSCKDAYNQIEDGHFIMAEDLLFFFVYGYYAKTYSEIEAVLYKYRWGTGSYSGLEEVIDLTIFKKFLSEKNVFDSIKRFIENKKDYDDYSNILLKIRNHLLRNNILVWNNRLQKKEKEDGFAMLIESWGSKNVAAAVNILTDELQSNYTQLNSCCISLQKELDLAKKECESARCGYTKLKSELKEKEHCLQKAEENLKNAEQNLANAKQKYNVIEHRLINTEENLSDKEKKLKGAEQKLKVAEQRFKKAEQKLKITDKTLRREKSSWNYKIGYAVTWIPKKIYYFLKIKRS